MKIIGASAAEIFDSVRRLAQTGQLQPGQALPPVRDLAATLDVNRNTVASAYKRLVAAGIAATQGRLGTVIRGLEGAGEQEGVLPGSPLIDLASGNPDPAWLPDLAAGFTRRHYRPRLYGEPPVQPELDAHARQWFAGDCPARFEIDLTHGAVDAIERLLSAYLVAGDPVAVEDPCFLSSINTLRISGFQALGVAVDAQGMQAESLEAALAQGAQAVIVTPRAHNPTGCSLSRKRASELRALLERHPHVLVIVDDHFALLCEAAYHSIIPTSAQRWALIRSVSKVLGPDLRLAFVASDSRTSLRLRRRLASGTNWVSHFLQDAVDACLSSSEMAAQVARARDEYAIRRSALASALAAQGIAAATPADGLNLWLPLRQDSQPIAAALARYGWLVRAGEAFGVQTPARGLRISVSTLDDAQAQRLAVDMRRVLGHWG
ncbi:MAG: transcriptional regulator PtsJ [Rubrivivax sp.]